MTPKDIQEAYKRAKDVLDGFKRPSEQSARDVVALVKLFSSKPEKAREDKVEMPEFFESIFK